jgi:hypothetical protein
MAEQLLQLGILQENIENPKSGKIAAAPRSEAIAEIEAQAWFLPEEETQTRKSRKTRSIIGQIGALKRSLRIGKGSGQKKPVHAKAGAGKSKPKSTK